MEIKQRLRGIKIQICKGAMRTTQGLRAKILKCISQLVILTNVSIPNIRSSSTFNTI